jgi:hypothetical protein
VTLVVCLDAAGGWLLCDVAAAVQPLQVAGLEAVAGLRIVRPVLGPALLRSVPVLDLVEWMR